VSVRCPSTSKDVRQTKTSHVPHFVSPRRTVRQMIQVLCQERDTCLVFWNRNQRFRRHFSTDKVLQQLHVAGVWPESEVFPVNRRVIRLMDV